MSSPPTQPPLDPEAALGDALPDPVLAPRALAELREAFAPSLEVSPEADARVLHTLHDYRRKKAHSAGFWRGFQIAAVLAIVASFMFYMNRRNAEMAANSAFAKVAAEQREAAKAREESITHLADAGAAEKTDDLNATTPLAAATYAYAVPEKPTILDVLNLARRVENSPGATAKRSRSGFKPTGEVVSPFEEVNELAAKVVGAEPSQVPALADRALAARDERDAFADSSSEGAERHDAPRFNFSPAMPAVAPAPGFAQPGFAETRILSYDIMLDVGSRALAAFQIEISMSAPDTARVTLMGVRGGDHPALQRQPLFDSRRVSKPGSHTTFTIANFDTGKDLPTGDVRVARIVLVVVGPGNPGVTARLVIAAGLEGIPIPAGLRVVERAPISGSDLKHKQLEKVVDDAETLTPAK
ncbi:MAG: hypothetical protein KF691_13575 [Phycisphaeraceae bacterium]|nr:hypothetical protein [Phycisphaeraceae bacterium]